MKHSSCFQNFPVSIICVPYWRFANKTRWVITHLGDGPLYEALSMLFDINQKVVVRKKHIRLSNKSVPLSDWINQHCFTGEILSITDSEYVIGKVDSTSFYGGEYNETHHVAKDFLEYEIQPLRAEPVFQTDPLAISMF